MPIDTVDIFGSDQVGIHLASVDNVLFHPPELPQPVLETLEATLGLEMQPLTVGGSNLVGALVCGNSRGIAIADIANEGDIDQLTSYGDVVVMEGGVNTAGNLLVVNEQGAVASPSIPHEGLEILAEVLAVDVASTTIAGQDVVGSLAVTNDQGVLLHPDVTPDEAMLIEFGDTGAPYMGIQLGNRWFVSMDYENHTSTLNMTQLGCREDESRCYALIALEDPGVANWLDPAGHDEGLIFMRWQGLESPPVKADQPRTRVLSPEELATYIKDLPKVSPEDRRKAVEVRRRAAHERFGG